MSNMTNAELEKIHAEIAKLITETQKINTERVWYPIAVATGLVATIVTITKLFL